MSVIRNSGSENLNKGPQPILFRSLASFGFRGIAASLAFVQLALFARWLGPEEFGQLSLFLALAAYLFGPVQAGLQTVVTREVSRVTSSGGLRGPVVFAAVRVLIFAAAPALAIGLALAPVFAAEANRAAVLAAMAVASAVLLALAALLSGVVSGVGDVLWAQVPEQVVRPALLVAAATVLMLGVCEPSPEAALGAYLIAGGGAVLGGLLLTYTRARFSVLRGAKLERPIVGSVLTVGLLVGLQTAILQTDILMLGALAGDYEVGIYRVGVQFASLGGMVIVAVNGVISPTLARLSSTSDRVELERLARRSSQLGFAGTLVTFAALAVFGQITLELGFGAEYLGAYYPMLIIVGAHMVIALSGSAVAVGSMLGLEASLTRVTAFMILPAFLFNFLLIPRFGANGAAVATVATVSIWRVALYIALRRALNINTSILGKPIAFAPDGTREIAP